MTHKEVREAVQLLLAEHEIMKKVITKIAEAERMGYGTQRTYGAMAQQAVDAMEKLHEKKSDNSRS